MMGRSRGAARGRGSVSPQGPDRTETAVGRTAQGKTLKSPTRAGAGFAGWPVGTTARQRQVCNRPKGPLRRNGASRLP